MIKIKNKKYITSSTNFLPLKLKYILKTIQKTICSKVNHMNLDERIVDLKESSDFFTHYHFDLDTGYGDMFHYPLFPGIDIIYNDFNADNCNQIDNSDDYDNSIIINHCNRGRFETVFEGNYIYLSEGDIIFSKGTNYYIHDFPLGYYSGFQITIDLDVAQKSVDDVIGKGIVDINKLLKKIVDNGSFVIVRSNTEIEHVISELYSVDDEIKEGYYKLKVMELLLFLKNLTIRNVKKEYPSLKEENIKTIKKIKGYLVEHLSENVTLDELSSQFNLSKTSIKNYFKIVFGKPLNTWRREYRLNRAAAYLEKTNLNIGEISERVGYKNHSKFTNAFKKYYDMTPNEYRNSR